MRPISKPPAVVVSLGLVAPPAVATHRCDTEEPYCGDRRTLVQKPERQEVISRVMGHHCYHDTDAGDPNRDERVLLSRVGVVFSNVTRHSGYLHTVTVYFEGRERQIMGSVDGFGRGKADFSKYDDRHHNPGHRITLQINKQVEFNDYEGRKDLGVYNIRHQPAASRPALQAPEVTREGRRLPASGSTVTGCTTSSSKSPRHRLRRAETSHRTPALPSDARKPVASSPRHPSP